MTRTIYYKSNIRLRFFERRSRGSASRRSAVLKNTVFDTFALTLFLQYAIMDKERISNKNIAWQSTRRVLCPMNNRREYVRTKAY